MSRWKQWMQRCKPPIQWTFFGTHVLLKNTWKKQSKSPWNHNWWSGWRMGVFPHCGKSMPSLTYCWNQLPHYTHKFSVSVCQGLFIMPFWSQPWGLQQEVPPLLIMWTHTENTSLWHWQPNHFVPSLQPAEFPEPKPAEEDPDQMKDDYFKESKEGDAESCADEEITESDSSKRKWALIFNVSKVGNKVKHEPERISQETNKWDFANFVYILSTYLTPVLFIWLGGGGWSHWNDPRFGKKSYLFLLVTKNVKYWQNYQITRFSPLFKWPVVINY